MSRSSSRTSPRSRCKGRSRRTSSGTSSDRRSWTSATTTSWMRRSAGSRSSSRAPGGPPRSGTRSTSSTEAGKKYDMRPIAPSEIRRIEAGILNYGSDMTLENNPYEVDLGWLVNLDKKADFIGKRALAKIKKDGVQRKLVGLEIHGPQIHAWATEYWDVKKDDKKVGHLTALTFSPRLKKNLAYAWVPIRLAKLGTDVTVATSLGEREATVVKKPFVDPKKDIPKS